LHFHPIAIFNPKMLLLVVLGMGSPLAATDDVQQSLHVPPGFSVNVYARDLPMARMLHFTAAGDLLVSRPRAGEIDLLARDSKDPSRSTQRRVLLSGLSRPHGIDIADGWLYVGESNAIGRVHFDEKNGRLRGDYERIVTGLGDIGNHWTKTVRVGPDGNLYVAQGSTCNVCAETDKRRATIMRFHLDGSGGEIYAAGLRNSVGMDWAPWDQQLYATDNGRDLLGDDFPPCELNRIVEGGFYGWPYINGFGVLDPDMGKGRESLLNSAMSPAFGFRAHNAPLGMHFLRSAKMPSGYERTALVALHGSWNRSKPDGYKVVALHWRDNGSIEQTDFLTGFEKNGKVIGRPVDVAEGPDGAIYVSDDYAGAVYRVAYAASPLVDNKVAPVHVASQADLLADITPAERAQLAERGQELFAQYRCANCHDPRFATELHRVREINDLSSRYSVETLQEFFVAPTPPMPIFPLGPEERRALAIYLLTRK
ncbi:MAG TPA: PQQ-dependent sugar dehydrogenase, partial [Spongiibacteraceae bacterium]|nr:PQQ-dependent sugar dehydrogenase [Spongiibacteraceae bacterium]